MMQFLPRTIGRALSGVRAGASKLTIRDRDLVSSDARKMQLRSPTFRDGGPLPRKYTADGDGISPPISWSAPPPGTRALVLLVEDLDSPSPKPLVHAIAVVEGRKPGLPEGALSDGDFDGIKLGLNSFMRSGYTPADPPRGHGPHRYVFELFALDRRPAATLRPGRTQIKRSMRGHVLGHGAMRAIYERE